MYVNKQKIAMIEREEEIGKITRLIGVPSMAGDALRELMDGHCRHEFSFSFVDFFSRVRFLELRKKRSLGFSIGERGAERENAQIREN